MADNKDSSVLFSLKELMNLEEDRIRQEREERQRAEQAVVSARLDAERRVKEEEAARLRGEDDRRRTEEQRLREESARHDAIRQAEVEKARLDAENAVRLEALRAQQEHERHIQAMRESTGKKNLKVIAISSALFALIVIGGGGFFIKNQLDAHDRERIRYEQEKAAQKAENDRLQKEQQEKDQALESLRQTVRDAKDENSRNAAQKALDDLQKKDGPRHTGGNAPRTPNAGSGPKPTNNNGNCQPGDPLCGGL